MYNLSIENKSYPSISALIVKLETTPFPRRSIKNRQPLRGELPSELLSLHLFIIIIGCFGFTISLIHMRFRNIQNGVHLTFH